MKDRPSPPGRLLPNEFGLFDTLGNVLEWCQDGLDKTPTPAYPVYQDPYTPGTMALPAADNIRDVSVLDQNVWRYIRSSSFRQPASESRSAFRNEGPAFMTKSHLGFRVVRTMPSDRR